MCCGINIQGNVTGLSIELNFKIEMFLSLNNFKGNFGSITFVLSIMLTVECTVRVYVKRHYMYSKHLCKKISFYEYLGKRIPPQIIPRYYIHTFYHFSDLSRRKTVLVVTSPVDEKNKPLERSLTTPRTGSSRLNYIPENKPLHVSIREI